MSQFDAATTDGASDAGAERSVGEVHAQLPRNARGLLRRKRWDRQFGREFRAEQAFPNLIVFKVADGARVRVRAGALARLGDLSTDDRDRLAWLGAAAMDVELERAQLERVIAAETGAQIVPFIRAEREEQTERERLALEARHGAEFEDLTTAGAVVLQREDMAQASRILAAMRANPLVEYAYLQPRGTVPRSQPACTDQLPGVTNTSTVAPTTYQSAPPSGSTFVAPFATTTQTAGHDISFARSVAGSTGPGVSLVDVEVGYHFNHENLPNVQDVWGFNLIDPVFRQHGTAVIGIATGCPTNFGPMGIAPSANSRFSGVYNGSPWFYSPALAIDWAKNFGADVILIEWQMFDTNTSGCYACPGGAGTCQALTPVETFPLERSMIRAAVASGVTVVEAAANAQRDMNLIPELQRRVDWNDPENSQALVVGGVNTIANIDGQHASTCPMAIAASNVGDRVDLSAWYGGVAANGYGESVPLSNIPNPALRFNSSDSTDVDQWYTSGFGGTSSASAIVAGAVVSLTGMWRFANGSTGRPAPFDVVRYLAATGTPEGTGVPFNVGPSLRFGMAAAAFRERVVGDVQPGGAPAIGQVVSASPVVVGGLTSVVVAAKQPSGQPMYSIFRGGAWYNWVPLPTWSTSFPGGVIQHDLNNVSVRQLADPSAPSTELLATDSMQRVVFSRATSIDPSPTSVFSAWGVVPSAITGATSFVTGVDFAFGYHDYFSITTSGQLRWFFRSVGSSVFSSGAPSLSSSRTIVSKIVALSATPERADLFAIDSNSNLVHASLDGNAWTGWTDVPGGANASMLDGAVVGPNRIALAVGWSGGTTMFRFDTQTGAFVALPVLSGGPSSVAINAVPPLSVRISAVDSVSGVRSTRSVHWATGPLSLGGTYTWTTPTAGGGMVVTPWQNSLGLAFGVDPQSRVVFRVMDQYFPIK